MLGTQSIGSTWTSMLSIACLLMTATALSEAQTEAKGHELTDIDDDYVGASGAVTRCGKYFVLETKTYGEFEVKRLHVSYPIADGGVALASKNHGDLDVVIDDSKAKPTLILKWENPGLERDRLELSNAAYQDAKACVPPPKDDEST